MTALAPIETSDLDLLDDDKRHGRCTACTGSGDLPPLTTFPALCGATGLTITGKAETRVPANVCQDCLDAWDAPCRRCGA